jgi:uncharacterized protein involved in type VI secretion and phage assembly
MTPIAGVVPGIVINLEDPENLGRVQLNLPGLVEVSNWARVAAPMAGPGRGFQFMPEIGDEVLVAFQNGDIQYPYILGYLWNGEERPPSEDPQLRLMRSKNGHEIAIYDPEIDQGDKGYIQLKDAHGNLIRLANASIKISCVGTIEINAPNIFINERIVTITGRAI